MQNTPAAAALRVPTEAFPYAIMSHLGAMQVACSTVSSLNLVATMLLMRTTTKSRFSSYSIAIDYHLLTASVNQIVDRADLLSAGACLRQHGALPGLTSMPLPRILPAACFLRMLLYVDVPTVDSRQSPLCDSCYRCGESAGQPKRVFWADVRYEPDQCHRVFAARIEDVFRPASHGAELPNWGSVMIVLPASADFDPIRLRPHKASDLPAFQAFMSDPASTQYMAFTPQQQSIRLAVSASASLIRQPE